MFLEISHDSDVAEKREGSASLCISHIINALRILEDCAMVPELVRLGFLMHHHRR